MSEFTVRTSDSVYSYDVADSAECKTANISFGIENNNVKSDTQGFLRKIQQGNTRINAKVILADSKARFESIIFPMLTYQDDLVCVFDRNIPLRTSDTANMVMEGYRVLQEFDDANAYEVELELTEVL